MPQHYTPPDFNYLFRASRHRDEQLEPGCPHGQLFHNTATAAARTYRNTPRLHALLRAPDLGDELNQRCTKRGSVLTEQDEWLGDAVIEKSARQFFISAFPGKKVGELMVSFIYLLHTAFTPF